MADTRHGSTPAAWTAVTIAIVAFMLGAIGLVISNWAVFWAGVAVLVIAPVVGKVMSAMGLGAH